MNAELQSLLHFTLSSSTGARDVVLQIPAVRELNGLISAETSRDERRVTRLLPLIILSCLARSGNGPDCPAMAAAENIDVRF